MGRKVCDTGGQRLQFRVPSAQITPRDAFPIHEREPVSRRRVV
jgi:hypothetical protein